MARIGSLFTLLLFLFCAQVQAQDGSVTATATVDRNTLRPGDTLTLTITVESEGGVNITEPSLPDLTGFNILNKWSGSEIQSTFTNGKFMTRRRLSYNYQLQLTEVGKYTIGSAKIEASGAELLTKPIEIEVSGNAPTAPQQAEQDQQNGLGDDDDIFEQLLRDRMERFGGGRAQAPPRGRSREVPNLDASEAFFIEVEVDKKKVYVGEQIVASYYLVTRGQVSDIDTLKYPTLAGFWKEDIELATRLNFKPEIINGIQYNRALLASYALFPIKAGAAQVDAYKAKCGIVNFNPFGLPGTRVLTQESKIVPIEVINLPAEGKPENFAGAVGQFTVKASLDKQEAKVNEPIAFRIRFEGRGNGKLIELPKVQFPKQLEVYSSKNESKYFTDGRSFKEFEYLLVPRETGQVQIPSLSVSLFNAETKKYYELNTKEMSLNILPGANGEKIASRPLELADTSEKRIVDTWPGPVYQLDLPVAAWHRIRDYVWSASYTSVLLGYLVWLAVALGWGKPRESLRRKTRARLKHIRARMNKGDFRFVGVESTNLAAQVLGELAELGGGGHDLNTLLEKSPPSFRNEYGEQMKKMLSDLESLAFAPKEMVEQMKNKGNLPTLLDHLEVALLKATEHDFQFEASHKAGRNS